MHIRYRNTNGLVQLLEVELELLLDFQVLR
jgi:hypothetical protein